jgi:hypothetical protein
MKGAVKTAPFSRSSTLVRRSVYGCSDSGARFSEEVGFCKNKKGAADKAAPS